MALYRYSTNNILGKIQTFLDSEEIKYNQVKATMLMGVCSELSNYLVGFIRKKSAFAFSNTSHKHWPNSQQLIKTLTFECDG